MQIDMDGVCQYLSPNFRATAVGIKSKAVQYNTVHYRFINRTGSVGSRAKIEQLFQFSRLYDNIIIVQSDALFV